MIAPLVALGLVALLALGAWKRTGSMHALRAAVLLWGSGASAWLLATNPQGPEWGLLALPGVLALPRVSLRMFATWVVGLLPLVLLAAWVNGCSAQNQGWAAILLGGTLCSARTHSAQTVVVSKIETYLRLLGVEQHHAQRIASSSARGTTWTLSVLLVLLSLALWMWSHQLVLASVALAWTPAAALLLLVRGWNVRRSETVSSTDPTFRLPRQASIADGPLAFSERPADGSEELFRE
ncbi:MAG: hypothetical protein EXS14_00650 [Planctomycetes bacterium]|nr:hypothetical protein [Planctomycetota bacterium]